MQCAPGFCLRYSSPWQSRTSVESELCVLPVAVAGIAYDSTRKRVFVTGKYWPRIFEIVPQPLEASNAQYQQLVRSCYVKA